MNAWRTDTARRNAALRLQRRYRQHAHAVGALVAELAYEVNCDSVKFVNLNVADSEASTISSNAKPKIALTQRRNLRQFAFRNGFDQVQF